MMLSMDLAAQLAADRSRDLARAAEASRLVALARCCQPSRRRAAAQLVEVLATARRRLPRLCQDAAYCVGA
jgi:hypothetical protein